MAIYCGVDIIEIERIKNSLDTLGAAFRDRIFTNKEIDYCQGEKGIKYESYAVRFAAKEAVSKAFGTGVSQGISWKDIEVISNEHGIPRVVLYKRAIEKFEEIGGTSISLSMSHCRDYAVAYVVIEVLK